VTQASQRGLLQSANMFAIGKWKRQTTHN